MEQMQIPADMRCEIDYEQPDLPITVQELRPIVFMDGDSYCCLLGPDPQAGVFGCGKTSEQAINDWDEHLRERMQSPAEGDEVATYIKEVFKSVK